MISPAASAGTSSCGQWPTPSSTTQSACASRSSRNRVAAAGQRQQPVLAPPHDADRALDALRVEQPVEVARGVQQRHRRRADRDAEQLVDEQLRRDVLVVGHEQLGRAAAALRRGEQRVGQRRLVDLALERGAARVAGERDRQDVVAALERGQDELPGAPGVDEAVQAHQRRPGPAAVGRREPRHLASTTEVATCRSGIDQ
jgi:uncharacterized protein with PIN domain